MSVRSVSSFGCLLGHGAHRAGDRGQVVTAEVDLCQGGDVTDGLRELIEMVVGQVEAPQTRKPGEENREDEELIGEHGHIL